MRGVSKAELLPSTGCADLEDPINAIGSGDVMLTSHESQLMFPQGHNQPGPVGSELSEGIKLS